jgi:CheY-like chemotaxis protein
MNARVVIAEDAALFRAGLARLIEDHGHQVCAAVGDGDALLAAVAEHQPDVVVADIRMPPTHTDEGLRAALEIRRHGGCAEAAAGREGPRRVSGVGAERHVRRGGVRAAGLVRAAGR